MKTEISDTELGELVIRRICPEQSQWHIDNFNYSLRLIDWMRYKHGMEVTMDSDPEDGWDVSFYKPAIDTEEGAPDVKSYACASDPSLPRAICVAALRAVGAPEVSGKEDESLMKTDQISDTELEALVIKRICPEQSRFYLNNLGYVFRLIERMRAQHGMEVKMESLNTGFWDVLFGADDLGYFYACESTLPRAICIAALRVVKAPEVDTIFPDVLNT